MSHQLGQDTKTKGGVNRSSAFPFFDGLQLVLLIAIFWSWPKIQQCGTHGGVEAQYKLHLLAMGLESVFQFG
jgi:hypothetical protein